MFAALTELPFLPQLLSWIPPGAQTLSAGCQVPADTPSHSTGSALSGGGALQLRTQTLSASPGKERLPQAGKSDARNQPQPPGPRPGQLLLTDNTLHQNLAILLKRSSEKSLSWQEGRLPDILL